MATSTAQKSTGYAHISPVPFFLALVVITLPAWLLDNAGNGKMAWTYIALIAIMFAVYNYQGLSNFVNTLSNQIGGK